MPVRKVVLCDDHTEAVVLQPTSDINQLEIRNITRSYLGYEPVNKILYKLHTDISKTKYIQGVLNYEYRWISMWNSISYASIKEKDSWSKIESALMAALKNNWKVIQVNGDVFKNILSFMEN